MTASVATYDLTGDSSSPRGCSRGDASIAPKNIPSSSALDQLLGEGDAPPFFPDPFWSNGNNPNAFCFARGILGGGSTCSGTGPTMMMPTMFPYHVSSGTSAINNCCDSTVVSAVSQQTAETAKSNAITNEAVTTTAAGTTSTSTDNDIQVEDIVAIMRVQELMMTQKDEKPTTRFVSALNTLKTKVKQAAWLTNRKH